MDSKILEYLNKERICALTILLPDGTPHSTTMHFSHDDNPLVLYFSTESTSRKCQGLKDGKSAKASVVMGFSEQEWLTLQLEGEIRIEVDQEKIKKIKAIHYPKHPNSQKFENDPATVFLVFTPIWYRYTDFNTHPLTILENQ